MKNLFERAKAIGLQTIFKWLPGGRIENDEYICINPTRFDNSEGSFKVNLKSGKWADFSSDDKGGDIVSCFAYLNRAKMEENARTQSYKNFEGGVQAEAAKEILTLYDVSYFPTTSDQFNPPVKKQKSFYDEWLQQTNGIESPPSPTESIQWAEKNIKDIGKEKTRWLFTDKKGSTLFYVVRFLNNGKKNDRPFTVWKKGNEYKWMCKGFAELCKTGFKIPLYNRHLFEIHQNYPILMVEGQKCAQAAHELLSDLFICTTEYGGLKNSELEILRGKTVYRWIDPDNAGAKKLKEFRELTKNLDITLKVIKSPVRKPKGWDIADAIKEGWTVEQLREHIEDEKNDSFVDDDFDFDFKIIGITNNEIWFFPQGSKIATPLRKLSLSKNGLMNLMDKNKWQSFFPNNNGGVDWDTAINHLLRKADNAPFYYNTMVRGAGAWKDQGRLVLHCGEYLIVDRQKIDLYDFDSEYIYEKKEFVPYSLDDNFTIESSQFLIETLSQLDFQNKTDYLILSGWLLLAPFGGALKWRPRVWISGAKGSGKSTIIDNIVNPILGSDFGNISLGTSSEAAIRRKSGVNSLPGIHDEMEADNKSYAENINSILMFYRVGSSGEGGIQKVGDNGTVQQWISQCMALFASIGAAIKNGADRSRISVINLSSPRVGEIKQRNEKFKIIEKKIEQFTRTWAIGFHSRTLRIWAEIERAIEIMITICSEILGTRREGDQLGTLLAGAYMVNHDTAPIASEAATWLKQLNIGSDNESKYDKSDEELVIDEILSHKLRIVENVHTYEMSISNLILFWFVNNGVALSTNEDLKDFNYSSIKIKLALNEYGVNPVKRDNNIYIQIAKNHTNIKKILKDTQWSHNYIEFLQRLTCSDGKEHGPNNFAGLNKRFIKLDAKLLLDQAPF